MNSSPDIYENGRPELVEWELFQIVLDLTFLKERIPTKKQNQIFYWWVLSLGEIKFVDWKSGGGKWKWYWFDKYGAYRPRWCAIIVNCSNYWTAIAGFFPSTCQKKRATWKGVKSVETTSTYLHSTIGRWYLRLIHLHQGTPFYHSILTGAFPYLKIDTLKISCPKNALWPRIWGWML